MTRVLVAGGLALCLALATAPTGLANCLTDPVNHPEDAQQVADARAQIAQDCPCDDTTPHGQYTSCAAQVARSRATADPPLLRRVCTVIVVRYASRSTCGKPGFRTCCQTNTSGAGVTKTRCSTKRDGHCTAIGDGTACVGMHTSCCDACTDTGCAP